MHEFEMPSWEDGPETPGFVEKAKPVDKRSDEDFQADWQKHREDIANINNPDAPKSEFQKAVEATPTVVPEKWLTQEERDAQFGAHPLTRHEMDQLEKKRPN